MWDPQQYLAFDDHRTRPFIDLLSRVAAAEPRVVVDLGCGPGHLTAVLARRWPGAIVQALDSAPEMVAAARARGIDATLGAVQDWRPSAQTDVVVCNAVLHWVPGHADLLTEWMRQLPTGAFLAVQVPGNFDAPSHRAIRQVAARDEWRDVLGRAGMLEPRAVLDPAGYADLLDAAGAEVDAWETTYLQRLTGADPVLEWVTGTALRPVRGALDDARWQEFTTQLAPLLRSAYPRRGDGTTWLPFRRVFVVGRKR
ncbi:trans-aconitate 2-methyltransferase [Nocardia asiatica]|uniref:trans-aconitate 2-methyltransferase n=1 Tax=Nocardia asiatica TaxID=209252 RepID=UPI0024549B02|nr:trans-aconitate 2-methyltransferase [Nocardia asiatica]